MAASEVTQLQSRRGSAAVWWAVLGAAAAAGLCAVFPPVRIVRLAGGDAAAATRSVRGLGAEELWEQRLLPSAERAVEVETLLTEIQRDADAARKAHARQVGLGGSYYYFVRGSGRVVSRDAGTIAVAVGPSTRPSVVLEVGHIFGNAVRDGTGLLDVNDYANSQAFNDLSAAFNKLVEERVLPALRERAVVGAEVWFAGVGEVADESTDLRPLRVVPVVAEVR